MEFQYDYDEVCPQCGKHVNLSARDDIEFCECGQDLSDNDLLRLARLYEAFLTPEERARLQPIELQVQV
jgi:hypothetical protein